MKFSIVKNYKIFFAITITFLIIGFGSMLIKGFNLGIDFTGGSIMDLSFDKPVQVAQVRDVLKTHDLGNSIIQLLRRLPICAAVGLHLAECRL